VSAYALTNDYAAGAAHFVRRRSLAFQGVRGRSKMFFLQDFHKNRSSLELALGYLWDHVADALRR
jgi:hypothetical protein